MQLFWHLLAKNSQTRVSNDESHHRGFDKRLLHVFSIKRFIIITVIWIWLLKCMPVLTKMWRRAASWYQSIFAYIYMLLFGSCFWSSCYVNRRFFYENYTDYFLKLLVFIRLRENTEVLESWHCLNLRCVAGWQLIPSVVNPTKPSGWKQMIKWFSHTAWPQVWSLETSLSFTQARRGWGEMLLDIYTDIQSPAWQHRRLLILYSLHTGMPRQTCSCLAALHFCGQPPPPPSQPSLRGDGHVWSLRASFSFPIKVQLFSAFFPPGIWFLNGNSPNCLPVVVGEGWQWFGLKCYQMRCGGVNPGILPFLYSFLPLLVSVHLRKSEIK